MRPVLLMRAGLPGTCQPFCLSFPSAGTADKQHHASVTWFWFWHLSTSLKNVLWRCSCLAVVVWSLGWDLSQPIWFCVEGVNGWQMWRNQCQSDLEPTLSLFYILLILLVMSWHLQNHSWGCLYLCRMSAGNSHMILKGGAQNRTNEQMFEESEC